MASVAGFEEMLEGYYSQKYRASEDLQGWPIGQVLGAV
jgi:hypothetical protein